MTKRCANGHYYDGDKFAMCPYCGAGDMDAAVDNGEATIPVFKGEDIFSSSSNTPPAPNYDEAGDMATVMLDQPPMGSDAGFGDMGFNPMPSAPMSQDPDATVSMGADDGFGSMGFNPMPPAQQDPMGFDPPGFEPPVFQPPMVTGTNQTDTNQAEIKELRRQKEEAERMRAEAERARQEAEQAKAEAERMAQEARMQAEEAKRQAAMQQTLSQPQPPVPTAPPAPAPQSGGVNYQDLLNGAKNNPARGMDDEKTVRLTPGGNLTTEPTVGWLIGVNGTYYGECFELKNGKNFIGRDPSMDVVLSQDASVSRIRHAVVLYESHERMFIAQPGESRELFYINDRVVLKNEQLKPYDTILVGTTKLVFFPLCGSRFAWEDLKEE